MQLRNPKNITYFLLFSTLMHFALYALLNVYITDPYFKNSPPTPKQRKLSLKMKKRLRTVGKKDGIKDIFTIPKKKKKKEISLQDLANTNNHLSTEKTKRVIKNKVNKNKENLEKQKRNYAKRARKIKKQLVKNQIINSLSISKKSKKLLKNKYLGANIVTPQGISENELNKLELVFYTFYKRVYQNIMSSVISNFNKMSTSHPGIVQAIESSKHKLHASVKYDYLGNIVAIKIKESSQNDHVHRLFENILTSMNTLNNPPKELLGKNKEFVINYIFNIN